MSHKGPAILECEEDKVIQQIEEIVAHLSKGNDEVQQKMQSCLTALQERLGHETHGIWECGVTWAVEAKRKEAAEGNEGHEQVQMAPNMVASGSHPQATLDSEEEEEEEQESETVTVKNAEVR